MPYAHPEALVSTEWLAAHLADPQVRILDSSFKQPGVAPTAREDYEAGHIPGAVFFDIDDVAEPGTSLPHMIPSAERFAAKIAERGIGNDDRVIVYDANGLSSAARAWWMLRLFGHDNVALLDGGLPRWKAEGRPLDTKAPAIPWHWCSSPRALIRRWCATKGAAVLANVAAEPRPSRWSMRAPPGASTAAPRRSWLWSRRRKATYPASRNLLPFDQAYRPEDQAAQERRRAARPVRRRWGGARPAGRQQLRLWGHRVRARLRALFDRPQAGGDLRRLVVGMGASA